MAESKFHAFTQMAPAVLKSLQRTLLDRSSATVVSQKIPFVESLPQQKLYLLSKLCVLRKYMPNQVVLKEGTEPEEKKFHILSHGELSVSVGNKRIRILREGDYFGAFTCLPCLVTRQFEQTLYRRNVRVRNRTYHRNCCGI